MPPKTPGNELRRKSRVRVHTGRSRGTMTLRPRADFTITSDMDIVSVMFEICNPFPGRLLASAMPFGPHDLDRSLWDAYRTEGVTHVLMLVSDAEAQAATQRDLAAFYRQHGMTVWQHPIPDFEVPGDTDGFRAMLHRVAEALQDPTTTLVVHCAAGRGRTGLFLACWAQEILGLSPEAALRWVRRYIPGAVETRAQEEFVLTWPLRVLTLSE